VTAVATGSAFVSPYSGSRLIADGNALSQAVRDGNWLDGGIAFLDTLGDGAAALSDPIGTLASCGLGWVMQHLKPLSTWLAQLAGSESNVAAVAGQWISAGSSLRETGAALTSRLRDLDGLSGDTVTTYVRFAEDTARHLGASGGWAESAASGLLTASSLVTRMRGIVKSAISQVVATAIEAMAVVAASMGLGMGYAIARVVTKVNQLVNKVVRPITQVLKSVKALTGLVQQLRSLFGRTSTMMSRLLGGRPDAVTVTAGTVVDASAATALGASGHDTLVRAGATADAWQHSGTGVTGVPGMDDVLVADASMAPGGGSLGGGGAGGVTLDPSSGLAGASSASGIANGAGIGGGLLAGAAVSSATSGGGGMGGAGTGRLMPPGAMAGSREDGRRSGLGVRRAPLTVVIEAREDDEEA
jgi:hypothetical protein